MLDLEKKINDLKSLNFKEYPREKIFRLLESIRGIVPIMTVTIPKGKRLVRSRINDKGISFSKKSELSFIPHEKNTVYKRASTPENTMFYASTSAPNLHSSDFEVKTTFLETVGFLRDNQSSDYVKITSGNWFVQEDLTLLAIIPYTQDYLNNDFMNDMKSAYDAGLSNLQEDVAIEALRFLEFISNEFSKNDIKGDYDYMISAIFSEMLMKSKSVDGVFYPSVQVDETCFNVAISPEAVRKIELLVVVECSIFKHKSKVEYCEDAIARLCGNEEFELSNMNNPHSRHLYNLGVDSIEELKSS